ncbi:MAG: sensor histidine kinase [Streptosporangiaceae bacterium]|nr:sensor histidine kinase [Streptosporangiaceae bacterium]
MTAERLRRLSASPWLDVAIGVAATVATWIELLAQPRPPRAGSLAGLMILAVLIGMPLARRRRAPLTVLTVVLAATVASGVLAGQLASGQGPVTPFLAVLLAVFSFGAYSSGRRVLAGGVILAACLGAVAVDGWVSGRGTDYGFWVAAGIFWVLGLLFRQRLLRVAELQAHADRLQAEQAEKARWAVVEERSRIARELHDVISHSVSVMVIQAGAARHTLDPADTEMRESLQSIQTAGREALAELRRLLGILRRPDDEPALAPVPGLARVGVLVEQMREAGLPTELRVEGEAAGIAPGVDLTAYRIIQEALTNSLRHAGPAQAQVSIRYRPHELDLEITDDGQGSAAHADGTGNGLDGMRERVALYGGTLDAGHGDAGFTVHARLPTRRAPA